MANSNNISVYALAGDPNWINETKQVDDFCNWITSYQKNSSLEEKFKGVHIDVEPYLTDNWETDRQKSIESYQNLLIKIKRETDNTLTLGVDIPFWFDNVSYTSSLYDSGILSDWIIKNTDEITLMAYRNYADGANGINQIIKNEVLLANKLHKPIIVGVETQKLPEAHLSFYNKSPKYFKETLSKVTREYERFQSFKGFSIHTYKSYKEFIGG
ncbi:hypothetical protein [Priestia megaterium]|uniref:hypothetical protein n=1 Tax=Priestia megaterium TaxID=1404 RepID=UPI00196A33F2|nr:hypothetical protein [Priestia megaterium]QSF42312.1 hypothetical protein ICR96_30190 [Priestia megaterium]